MKINPFSVNFLALGCILSLAILTADAVDNQENSPPRTGRRIKRDYTRQSQFSSKISNVNALFGGTTPPPTGTDMMTSTQDVSTGYAETDVTSALMTTTPTSRYGTEIWTSAPRETTTSMGTEFTSVGTEVTKTTAYSTTDDMETDVTTSRTAPFTTDTPTGSATTSASMTTRPTGTETMTTVSQSTADMETDQTTTRTATATLTTQPTGTEMTTTASRSTTDMETDQTTTGTATASSTMESSPTEPTSTQSTATPTLESTMTWFSSTASIATSAVTSDTTHRTTDIKISSSPATTRRVTTVARTTRAHVIGPLPEEEPDYPEGEEPQKTYFYDMVLNYAADVSDEEVKTDVEKIFCPYYEEYKAELEAFIDCFVTNVTSASVFARSSASLQSSKNVSVSYDVIYDATSEIADLRADEIYEMSGLREDLDNGTIEGNFTVVQQPCDSECGELEVDWCGSAVCETDLTPRDTGISCTCESNCLHGHCQNDGICEHPDSGIACTCRSGNGWYYFGSQCEQLWYRWYGFAIFGGVVLALFLAIIVIVVCCLRRRQKDIEQVKAEYAAKKGKTRKSEYSASWQPYFNEAFQIFEGEEIGSTDEDAEVQALERTWMVGRRSTRDSAVVSGTGTAPSLEMSDFGGSNYGSYDVSDVEIFWSRDMAEASFPSDVDDGRTTPSTVGHDSSYRNIFSTFQMPAASDIVTESDLRQHHGFEYSSS